MSREFDLQVPTESSIVRCWFVDDDGMERWLERLQGLGELRIDRIGPSRAGRDLYGMTVGSGASVVSVTAGAHADEPAGPMTAMLLAEWLSGSDSHLARELRKAMTFVICPQVNPDGAAANSEWFSSVPDLATYLRHVRRELPGDDVEFGYPGDGTAALRPENKAVSDYLSRFAPARAHCSLHSMAFASGAWFLLGGGSLDRVDELQSWLVLRAAEEGFGLHDIDRRGEKGFRRLSRGFCTTPDSRAMAEHFRNQGDDAMAEKFRLSSMEWTLERCREAMLLVTEVPMFALESGYSSAAQDREETAEQLRAAAPEPGATAYEKFQAKVKPLVAAGDYDGALTAAREFGVVPVPFAAQCRLMFLAVLGLVLAVRGGEAE